MWNLIAIMLQAMRPRLAGCTKVCLVCLLMIGLSQTARGQTHDHDHMDHDHHVDNHDHKPTSDLDPGIGSIGEGVTNQSEVYKIQFGYFLDKLFEKYGDGHKMSKRGLEHLLFHLGLGGKIVLGNENHSLDHSHEYNVEQHESEHADAHDKKNIPESHGSHGEDNGAHLHEHDGHDTHEHDHNHDNDLINHEHQMGLPENLKHSDEHSSHEKSLGEETGALLDKSVPLNTQPNITSRNPSQESLHKGDDSHEHHDHSDTGHEHTNNEHVEHTDHEHTDHEDTDHAHTDHEHEDTDHAHTDHEHEDTDHAHTDHEHEDTDHVHTDHEHEDTDHAHTDHEYKDTDHAHTDHEHANGNVTHNDDSEEYKLSDKDLASKQNEESHKGKRSVSLDQQCFDTDTMLRLVNTGVTDDMISKDAFRDLCPVLVYQIDADTCHNLHNNLDHQHHSHHHEHETGEVTSGGGIEGVTAKVWGFSCIAVVIISLVGLLGVAVIPIMQKVFYNHMLQFLVALAVGALAGDALLHLLPHAIAGGHGGEGESDHGHSHGEDSHAHDLGPIYKGLGALMGIYFFFVIERILTIITEMKRKRKKLKNRKNNTKEREDSDHVGERLAQADMCDEMLMSIHPNKDGEAEIIVMNKSALQGYAAEAHSEHCAISFGNSKALNHQHGCHDAETAIDGEENDTMISHNNSASHGHGHGHGHSHCADGVPNSVSAVAWMVILGDGIHNFSDGLAIGAAFANSITGGFSTSIAVFCHELPHEIGDFAMLLRAGMSPKQAIFYNCVSSILCFVGMVIGVAIGNIEGASLWIFTIVAGMFLYIALVDMLPEMSSVETKKGENPFCHLLLQFIGMMIGGGIMFLIAIFEGDLQTILD
ncbi:zinc transporter ZIP10-like isoform X2 [Mya arenaria]|uniref:zinc transporter ZIP10-like isoform X2 n=1 Tax=Mya arenaria TaxID=6604 RepID=UPI0022E0DEAE|nr:zinc transporter ZIP10-like isoform X2 [Mya arenaria]